MVTFALVAAGLCFGVASFFGKIAPWTGRFYSLLDPSYAKNNIPIIASGTDKKKCLISECFLKGFVLGSLGTGVGIGYC